MRTIDRDMLLRLLESGADEGFHLTISCWRTVTDEDRSRRYYGTAQHTGPYRYGLNVRVEGLTTIAGLERLIAWAKRQGIELHQCGSTDAEFETVIEARAQFDEATPIP